MLILLYRFTTSIPIESLTNTVANIGVKLEVPEPSQTTFGNTSNIASYFRIFENGKILTLENAISEKILHLISELKIAKMLFQKTFFFPQKKNFIFVFR